MGVFIERPFWAWETGWSPRARAGSLVAVTPPTVEPLELDKVRSHLRVTDTADDELILTFMQAAREYVEQTYGLALMPQTWDWVLDGVSCEPIQLPRRPVQSVVSVSYVDGNGVTQAWDVSQYRVDANSGRVTPEYGYAWPTIRDVTRSVTIRFTAGYASAMLVPASIKVAMQLLIGHWYENREAVLVANAIPQTVPFAVESLLQPFALPHVA